MIETVKALQKKLGKRVLIPAHHYQIPEIVQVADIVGDSYKLAVEISLSEAEYVVFCGVRFMAEGAAVLAKDYQKILLPAPEAGCPMADMISLEQAKTALAASRRFSKKSVVPIIYMNSYSDVKAFCGEYGGSVCTSSNARIIVTDYLRQGIPVFFGPDYCLGKNTARELGFTEEEMAVIDSSGSVHSKGTPDRVKVFLWNGNCNVHQRFSGDHIARLRSEDPDMRIIVHPEVRDEVAVLADESGSTQYIYNRIRDAAPGTSWGVGTEYNFVTRIAAEFPDKKIVPLYVSRCVDMEHTTIERLACMLKAVADSTLERDYAHHIITVPRDVRSNAAAALQRMISIVERHQ